MSNIASLLNQARKDGLHIRADAGQVRLRGPSEVIQKWRPLLAEHKAGLLKALAANETTIPADLEALIQESALFWEWGDDDLLLIRATAAKDPEGIRLTLKMNPLRPYYGTGTVADTPLGGEE